MTTSVNFSTNAPNLDASKTENPRGILKAKENMTTTITLIGEVSTTSTPIPTNSSDAGHSDGDTEEDSGCLNVFLIIGGIIFGIAFTIYLCYCACIWSNVLYYCIR